VRRKEEAIQLAIPSKEDKVKKKDIQVHMREIIIMKEHNENKKE